MEKNADYTILRSVLFDNGRGFAFGQHESPRAPQPFVTWQFAEEQGRRDYYWGHYHGDAQTADLDFSARIKDYQRMYHVRIVEQPERETYQYYSTQRPVDIGTYPKPAQNQPIEIINYDSRLPVEDGVFSAWGVLFYAQPLTGAELRDYELRPSRYNPDERQRIHEQAQAVGKWEEAQELSEGRRVTRWSPQQGCFMLKDKATPERLAECMQAVELREAIAAEYINRRKGPAPISQQMKQAQKLAEAERGPVETKKADPDRGGR